VKARTRCSGAQVFLEAERSATPDGAASKPSLSKGPSHQHCQERREYRLPEPHNDGADRGMRVRFRIRQSGRME